MEDQVGYEDVVDYVSASILSGPEDDIWDQVFDWVYSAAGNVINTVIRWIDNAVDWITYNVSNIVNSAISSVSSFVSSIYSTVRSISSWVHSVYSMVSDWVSSAYFTVRSAVTSAINTVNSWIQSAVSTLTSWVTTRVHEVWEWITTSVSNLSTAVRSWFSEQWASIQALVATWGENIVNWLTEIRTDLSAIVPNITGQLESWFTWLSTWIAENVISPVDTWWNEFVTKLLDFGGWVGKLADAIWNWLQEDIPGHSPRVKWIWEDLFGWLYYWFGWYAEKVAADPPRAAMRIFTEGLGFIGNLFGEVAEVFWEAVDDYVGALGPTNPDIASSHAKALGSLGLTALTGLAGMTLASSWMKPLGGAGMGQIAAMIYDMTNYKVITGASITALTVAAVKTPMTYHFNELFRPNLLEPRDFMQLMSRKAFVNPEPLRNPALTSSMQAITGGDGEGYELKWLGYHGYPSVYHGLLKELANTPLRYFPLAGIARTGFFDKEWFTEALNRSGYSQTAIDALMVMYKKMRDEALQGAMSGAAVTRFKEGFTTETQFAGEMELLGYSDEQFIKYLAAAKMDYATDYLRDLISAYRDAVRKGNLTMDEYREKLLVLGVVPERVEAYVLKERARLKPKEDLTSVSPATPLFETDAGKVQVDTLRRQRRKLLITRDQELSSLITLGMDTIYATAIADNDDVRLAEKAEEG